MLIDGSLYAWRRDVPVKYILESSGILSFEGEARRIYMMELSSMTKGSVSVYADEEKKQHIGTAIYPDSIIAPEKPLCTDMVYICGDGMGAGVDVIIYSEKGILKSGMEEFVNTTDGMTNIRNSANDDGTDSIAGAGWFKFNGATASTVYVSGNHWIGFGTSSQQLNVCNRDGKCYSLYRQEGQLSDGTKFLKIRWEGYTVYNSTSSSCRLIFELFLLENNDIYLNVVQTPTSSSYFGTSQLVCNGKTVPYSVCDGTGGGKSICFYHQDEDGKEWKVAYEKYQKTDVYTNAYLVRSQDRYYTVENGELIQVDMAVPTSAYFYRYGTDSIPDGNLLLGLANPEVLFWTNDPADSLLLKAELTVYPFPQTLLGFADMRSDTIKGIRMIAAEYSGSIGVRTSYDGGTKYGAEITLDEFLTTDVGELWKLCQTKRMLHIRFILYNGAELTRFKITYEN